MSQPRQTKKPLVIAGPCAAETYDLIKIIADQMTRLAEELDFDYIFKASFDKANRTSANSKRGHGLEQTLEWFKSLKKEFPNLRILTDVHETYQVTPVAEVVDMIQIPAFLCRQSDLVTAAAESGRDVNIKKGQFLSPDAMTHIYERAASVAGSKAEILLTERGATFGYGNLVVDPRSFAIMAQTGARVIFDVTHSTQLPALGGGGTSGGQRQFAPVLARAAAATGYCHGLFLEVHTNPEQAISDKDAQLRPEQAEALLRQVVPLLKAQQQASAIDSLFN